MNVIWCCLLTVLLTAHAAVDVERTVLQVQSILKENSQLPRLSREEIIQLLNDIRAEDAKSASKEKSTEASKSISTESTSTEKATIPYESDIDNEIKSYAELTALEEIEENVKYKGVSTTTESVIEATKPSEPSVMVVLPYTPRDGSSLQELFTRPPRVEMVLASQITPETSKRPIIEKPQLNSPEKIKETFTNNVKLAQKVQKHDIPSELQEFLNMHGLSGKPGNDHFLLPIEGFKPLPPPKIVDGSVQLPENILLTYDLVASESDTKKENDKVLHTDVLYKPLPPEFPFELDASPSESLQTVLPLDLPKKRPAKSTASVPSPNYEPIDYDSVKVIPLQKGPRPEDNEEVAILETETSKRQADNSTADSVNTITTDSDNTSTTEKDNATTTETPETSTLINFLKDFSTIAPIDSSAADSDAGASIADLEDSFGGAAPSEPGDAELPPPRKNGFYWMLDWNSFLEVGDGDTKVNIRLEPKLGDPQMFLPVNVP